MYRYAGVEEGQRGLGSNGPRLVAPSLDRTLRRPCPPSTPQTLDPRQESARLGLGRLLLDAGAVLGDAALAAASGAARLPLVARHVSAGPGDPICLRVLFGVELGEERVAFGAVGGRRARGGHRTGVRTVAIPGGGMKGILLEIDAPAASRDGAVLSVRVETPNLLGQRLLSGDADVVALGLASLHGRLRRRGAFEEGGRAETHGLVAVHGVDPDDGVEGLQAVRPWPVSGIRVSASATDADIAGTGTDTGTGTGTADGFHAALREVGKGLGASVAEVLSTVDVVVDGAATADGVVRRVLGKGLHRCSAASFTIAMRVAGVKGTIVMKD